MNISTSNMKLNLNTAKINEKEEKWIEQDVIVPDNMPDALKIISVNSKPYINDIELTDNRIKVVGKIHYSIIYRANDENMSVRGLNVCVPFSTTIENTKAENISDVVVKACLKNIIYSLPNERKFAIKNEVTFFTQICSSTFVEVIKDFSDCKDIEYNKCKNVFNNVKEKKKCYIASSEDIIIPKEASAMYEILKYDAKIKDTEYKESYNKLMLKGVLELSFVYVGESKEICKEKMDIPFSSMVELTNITEKSNYDMEYILRDLNIRINPDIEQRTLNVDYKIENNLSVYEKEEVEYIEDFYSRTRDLNYDVKDISISSNNNEIVKEISISDTISDILTDNQKIVEYNLDTSSINLKYEDEEIKVNGIAKLNMLVQDKNNGELENKSIELMVDQIINLGSEYKDSNVNFEIEDYRINVIQNGTSINIKVVIYVKIIGQKVINMSSISNIEDKPIDLKNISSINIYIVRAGDSIWKIAKKYKTSMDNIIKINNIENPNHIDIGQKLLIIR